MTLKDGNTSDFAVLLPTTRQAIDRPASGGYYYVFRIARHFTEMPLQPDRVCTWTVPP